jgi:hypothetical protein
VISSEHAYSSVLVLQQLLPCGVTGAHVCCCTVWFDGFLSSVLLRVLLQVRETKQLGRQQCKLQGVQQGHIVLS